MLLSMCLSSQLGYSLSRQGAKPDCPLCPQHLDQTGPERTLGGLMKWVSELKEGSYRKLCGW